MINTIINENKGDMDIMDKPTKLNGEFVPTGEAVCYALINQVGDGMTDFNGHFWVELDDGTIVDDAKFPDKKEFMGCFSIKKCSKIRYDECKNPMTNIVVMNMLKKYLTALGDKWEDVCDLFGKYWKPLKLCCMFNAIANQNKYGGTIKFGCNYMFGDDGITRYYIRGGEGFSTYGDFKKEYDHLHQLKPKNVNACLGVWSI
tara:strand:+ start:515 stop:1120 length:606 start_codon:yes stop_codon:yes gene_type:complete